MLEVENLVQEFRREFEAIKNLEQWIQARDRYLSRERGLLTRALRSIGRLPPEERPQVGKRLNEVKEQIEALLEQRLSELKAQMTAAQLERQRVDITLPGYQYPLGMRHPLQQVREEFERIFVRMGFMVMEGPEVEEDYYNFEALNIPANHPARADQDTFYITTSLLLRTHTSPVQVRAMEKLQPPVRIVCPGRVFRRDAPDATHSPMFHQIEGLVVDEGITMGDLKGTLEFFLREAFGSEIRVRFRPGYFQFVEPGAEVDISCIFCGGNACRMCKQSGWIEILGAGMVHPNVFRFVKYDPNKYTGFAWGMGIERVAQLKYGIDDIRLFFENDLRFLRQFN
ncbi:MAG: phenylalanine--tRNA ligase subunit alpha [Acidobacteria bacterium]|nr:phenylalanine--tRNA ligase subunit alpha [Acidobacteriota bacterium]